MNRRTGAANCGRITHLALPQQSPQLVRTVVVNVALHDFAVSRVDRVAVSKSRTSCSISRTASTSVLTILARMISLLFHHRRGNADRLDVPRPSLSFSLREITVKLPVADDVGRDDDWFVRRFQAAIAA